MLQPGAFGRVVIFGCSHTVATALLIHRERRLKPELQRRRHVVRPFQVDSNAVATRGNLKGCKPLAGGKSAVADDTPGYALKRNSPPAGVPAGMTYRRVESKKRRCVTAEFRRRRAILLRAACDPSRVGIKGATFRGCRPPQADSPPANGYDPSPGSNAG